MMNVALSTLAFGAVALAQTTVVDVLMPGWDSENLLGSVKGVEKSITTFVFECKEGTDSLDCGLAMAGTIFQGESTWSQSTSFSAESDMGEYILTYACDVNKGDDEMVCRMSQEQTYDGTTETTTTTETVSDLQALYEAVTITAGVDKLDPSPGASTTAAETTATETETETQTETSVTTATGTESGSTAEPTDDSAEETTSNTDNAGPRATQNAVVAGVVGIIGAAAIVM